MNKRIRAVVPIDMAGTAAQSSEAPRPGLSIADSPRAVPCLGEAPVATYRRPASLSIPSEIGAPYGRSRTALGRTV